MLEQLFNETAELSFDSSGLDAPCFVATQGGFHMRDPLYFTAGIWSMQDCFLLCLQVSLCRAGNFIQEEQNERNRICIIHSSNFDTIDEIIVKGSTYFEFMCDRRPHIITHFVNKLPAPIKCGLAMSNTEPGSDLLSGSRPRKRIVGGFPTQFYSQPWHGWVLHDRRHICGASLIATSPTEKSTVWAITAAHCFTAKVKGPRKSEVLKRYVLLFGGQDWQLITPHIMTRRPKNIHWPNFYGNDSDQNDIALIELAEPIAFNAYVLPICLPKLGIQYSVLLAAAKCYVCGIGFTKDRPPFRETDRSELACRLQCITTNARIRGTPNVLTEASTNQIYAGHSAGDSGGSYSCSLDGSGPKILLGIINGRVVSYKYFYYYSRYMYYSYYAFVPAHMHWIRRLFYEESRKSKPWCTSCRP